MDRKRGREKEKVDRKREKVNRKEERKTRKRQWIERERERESSYLDPLFRFIQPFLFLEPVKNA